MSPIVTGIASPPGFARSCSTIASESSIPVTGTPFAASARPTRPVPIASSSAGRPAASAASRSTAGSRVSGANIVAESWS